MILYSFGYISKVVKSKVLAEVLCTMQSPIFTLLSLPCRIPVLEEIFANTAINWPFSTLGFILRSIYWKTKLEGMGLDVFIDRGVSIRGANNITVGSNVYIDELTILRAEEGYLEISNDVKIGACNIIMADVGISILQGSTTAAFCKIYSITHTPGKGSRSTMVNSSKKYLEGGKIIVGVGALIGVDSILLPGVYIGNYSTVGANSVVKEDVSDYSVVAGNPARIVK
jgi:acetyltransferase-like isoleucine patch superfamily enzyme